MRSSPAFLNDRARAWALARDDEWKAQTATASLEPFRGYATALHRQLAQAIRALDPLHVTKLG